MVIFIIIFVLLPIFIFIDIIFLDRKYYKLGKSYVERHVQIISQEDITTVFEQCRYTLGEMKSFIYKRDTPRFFKARLGESIITVLLNSLENNKTLIKMSSDAQWMTVKFDMGENQRNVNKFQTILERLTTMNEVQKQTQSQGELKKYFGENVKFVHPKSGRC